MQPTYIVVVARAFAAESVLATSVPQDAFAAVLALATVAPELMTVLYVGSVVALRVVDGCWRVPVTDAEALRRSA